MARPYNIYKNSISEGVVMSLKELMASKENLNKFIADMHKLCMEACND